MTIDDIKRQHKGYFFNKDTIKFFKSRVLSEVYEGPGGIYFITSEKGSDNIRGYTVRHYDPITNDIRSVTQFNQLTKYYAIKEAKLAAKGGNYA